MTKATYTGRSLRELIGERDRLTEETGHYYGIRELALKAQDPLRYEWFYSRLVEATIAARETAKFVAASPGAREMGELLFAFLTPEGDPATISLGLSGHLAVFDKCVKWMVENGYEENPGIRDGDIFTASDPFTSGSPHPGDVFTFVPVFSEGELVGWAGAMNHIIETGGMMPGSWPPVSPDTFTDGFVFPPTKTGENCKYYAWWFAFWKRRTRAATFNILDDQMRLSGCLMIRKRVFDIIRDFGLDYFRRAIREVVEEERAFVAQNIRLLTVPGVYRNALFRAVTYKGLVDGIAPHASKDSIIHAPVKTVITPEALLIMDLEGSSRWGFHSYNAYKGAVPCAVALGVMDQFSHTTKVNGGLVYQTRIIAPKGSVYNPDYDYCSAANPWATTVQLIGITHYNTSRAFYCRGFVEECWTGEDPPTAVMGSLILPGGQLFGFTNLEYVGASGTGAFAYKDGIPTGWCGWNQMSDIGNEEEWEFIMPYMYYLGRRLIPNYCGHGKYRGAVGQASTFLILSPRLLYLNPGAGSQTTTTHTAMGACGGYPAPNTYALAVHGTNTKELIDRGVPYPRDPVEVMEYIEKGVLTAAEIRPIRGDTLPVSMGDGDIWAHAAGAGGGWGDPLERAPQQVAEDVRYGFITPDVAESVHGVILTRADGEWRADEAATAGRRREIREARRARGRPCQEWWEEERERVKKMEFIDPVRDMYKECLSFAKFCDEFSEFWQVDEEEIRG